MIELDDDDLRLIELFREKAADRRHELQLIAIEQDDKDRKHRHDLTVKKEEEERKLQETLATPAQVELFDEHLDSYDTATVQALMDNQHALDQVVKEQQAIDAAASRLPDGRMAFKTEDGRRVFDQHGAELGADIVHPDAIPGTAPTWEAKQKNVAEHDKLVGERDALHDYQHRLDQAREAAGKDGVTAEALARMDSDLKRDMPDAVRQQLPGGKPSAGPMEASSTLAFVPERMPSYGLSAPAPVAP